jgi:hypothetical protein
MIDERILQTIYALCILTYVISSLYIYKTKVFSRLWTGSIIVASLTGVVHIIQWIWS